MIFLLKKIDFFQKNLKQTGSKPPKVKAIVL